MSPTPLAFLAFSDIHYAEYSTGVTVADIARIERAFNAEAMSRCADFCIFAGDRFLSHQPDDWIRLEADRVQRERDNLGLVTFSLIGNHDLWGKSLGTGHSNRQAQDLWKDQHPNLVIMDEAASYDHPKLPGVRIHALPAGTRYEDADFHLVQGGYNILVFHGLVQGSCLDRATAYASPKGIPLASLDHPQFDLVLGGDVHLPQKLPFRHTRGGYIGACLQQSRRDRGDGRGFLWVELGPGPGELTTEYLPSPCPRFVDLTWDLDASKGRSPTPEEVRAGVWAVYEEGMENTILDLTFTGQRAYPTPTAAELAEIGEVLGVRRVNPPQRRYTDAAGPSGIELSVTPPPAPEAPEEAFAAWLRTGVALDGLDPDRLLALATPVLRRVVSTRGG